MRAATVTVVLRAHADPGECPRSCRTPATGAIAADGASALRVAIDERPDLGLLDLMLPRLDGAGGTGTLSPGAEGDPGLGGSAGDGLVIITYAP